MLITYFGRIDENKVANYENNPGLYFDDFAKEEWFKDKWTKDVIERIDDSTCYDMYNIKSKVLGGINYEQLSSGAKTLIAAKFCDIIFNANRIGDNCWEMLFELSKERDIYISQTYTPKHGIKVFDAIVVNTMQKVNSYSGYLFLQVSHMSDVYTPGSIPEFENMNLDINSVKELELPEIFGGGKPVAITSRASEILRHYFD